MNHLDLFSGIGGFALAAKWAEIETIQFVEIDKFCQKVLRKNFPDIPIFSDIKKFGNFRKVDLITGGFPCQPFSQAGNKKGKNDVRYLWNDMLRIIGESSPDWIIIENVRCIISLELDNILFDLEKYVYSTETFLLPACAANAPHRRDRVWIIAYSNRLGSDNRINHFHERYLQKNWQQYLEKIQQKWAQFIPDAWSSFTARDWFQYNSESSRKDDGISDRLDRIKGLGNAIVPQIAYVFMSIIKEIMENK